MFSKVHLYEAKKMPQNFKLPFCPPAHFSLQKVFSPPIFWLAKNRFLLRSKAHRRPVATNVDSQKIPGNFAPVHLTVGRRCVFLFFSPTRTRCGGMRDFFFCWGCLVLCLWDISDVHVFFANNIVIIAIIM